MRINSTGNVGIGDTTPTEAKLTVGGDIFANVYFVCTQGTACSSDRRLKSHLTPLDSSLCRLASLTGVYYDWDRQSFPERNFPAGRQIGLIAQEEEEVYPELVRTDAEGFKSLSYDKLTAVLVEAVKELKKQNEALAEANKVQQDQIDLMRQEFEERLLALEQGR